MTLQPDAAPSIQVVDQSTMQRVFDAVKTPYKYGVILHGENNAEGKPRMLDCPNVFWHVDQSGVGKWYMMYVCMNDVGYETHLADSDDLLNWTPRGKVLSFRSAGKWDQWQGDGGLALFDIKWGGTNELQTFAGKYWLSYIGGALQGYEPDPLSIGLASTSNPTKAIEWERFAGNPVMGPFNKDVRDFEKRTLYKSNIIRDETRATGHEFVMFYNGKQEGKFATERIGMAVSDDMVSWKRFGVGPVVDNGPKGISGDPQITRIGDVWVMFYFGHVWQPKAFDTFAVSRDLIHWTLWKGQHLIEPSETWDATFAHKPWVIKHDGIVYHFYCAVGDEGRVIAVATSRDLRN